MECRTESWRETRAQTKADLGGALLPEPAPSVRDRALFDLEIDSKLRGCDVVKIKIGVLVSGGQIRNRAIVVQRKTDRLVQFELMDDARTSLLARLERRGGMLDG